MSGAMTVQPGTVPGPELARVVCASLARVQAELSAVDADPEAAVFAARRRLKRVRATARLLRAADAKAARAVNAACRDAARALSAVRDAHAAAEAADSLARRARSSDLIDALTRAAAELRATALAAPMTDPVESAAAALPHVTVAHQHAEQARPKRGPQVLHKGLRRLDARAAAAFAAYRYAGDTEARHDWRKRLKDRWHAERIVRKRTEADLPRAPEDVRAIARLLGEERDLDLLDLALADLTGLTNPMRTRLRAAIRRRRRHLLGQAAALGDALHGDRG